MISKSSLAKIKAAYAIWLKDNDETIFYHPDLVEELASKNKSIQDFHQIHKKIPKIVQFRPFFNGWLNDEIDELNLKVLTNKFELGQNIKFIKAILKKTKETKSVLKSGERIELTAYGDSKLQNREVVAYVFKFTDGLLTAYEDNTDKATHYFRNSDNPIDLALEGSDLIEFLKSNGILDLLSANRIFIELQKTYSGSGLILHLKDNALLHVVPGDEIYNIIRKDKKGFSFIDFIRINGLFSDCPKTYLKKAIDEIYEARKADLEKIKGHINSSYFILNDRATLLLKENQLKFNKEISKSKLQEYDVPSQYYEKFYAVDEYLALFQDGFNHSKFSKEDFSKMGLSDLESSNKLDEQTIISNKIQELFVLNESRALELGSNGSSTSGGWYTRKWLVYLLLFLFFPAGLYGLAKSKSFSGFTKLFIFGLFGFLMYSAYNGNVSDALNNSVITPVESFQIDTTMGPSFIFTNKAKDTISVAYGYKYKKGWRSIGWYQIKPDSSIQLAIPTDLTNDAVYWYAESMNGLKWAGKDKKFCIDPQNAFDIKKKKTAKCRETAVFTKRLLTQTFNTIDIQ